MPSSIAIQYQGEARDLDRRLSAYANRVLHFDHVPLLVAKVDGDERRDIEASPDVVDVRPIPDDQLKMVEGIDWVLRWAVPSMTQVHPNGDSRRRGGVLGDAHAYPVLVPEGPELISWDDELVEPTRLGWLAALNLSVGRGYGERTDPGDPVNIATRAAAAVAPVVMAAGRDALSTWAAAEWVVAVGATADEAGTALLQGSPPGVDVVAWARSSVQPYKEGTSFAAARASGELISLTAFALVLDRAATLARGGQIEGIPTLGLGIVDRGFEREVMEFLLRDSFTLNALPIAGVRVDAVADALALLEDASVRVDTTPGPGPARRLLEKSARAGKDHSSWGYGFVDSATTAAYITDFSGTDLAAIYASSAELSPALEKSLSALRLTDGDLIERCLEVWRRTATFLTFDYMRAPEPYVRREGDG